MNHLCRGLSRTVVALILAMMASCGVSAQHGSIEEARQLEAQVTQLSRQGRNQQGIALELRALAIKQSARGPLDPDIAVSLNTLAGLYQATGRYARAEPPYQRALAIREKVLGPTHPYTVASLNNLAGLYWASGAYAKAEPLLERALAIGEKALGPEHPYTASTLSNLAFAPGDGAGRRAGAAGLAVEGGGRGDPGSDGG